MKDFIDKRYVYCLLETSEILAQHASGSMEGYQNDFLLELQDWLEWRINEGWEENKVAKFADYENAVRALAKEALRLSKTGSWNERRQNGGP